MQQVTQGRSESMAEPPTSGPRIADDPLAAALDLMRRALELIDQSSTAPDVGAHLDLAIDKLSDRLVEALSNVGNDNAFLVRLDQAAAEPPQMLK
jgi:hypothetical protein